MNIEAFLKSGAIYSAFESPEIWVSWGVKKESDSISSYPSYYLNDFYIESPRPFISFENNLAISKKELKTMLSGFSCKMEWQQPSQQLFKEFFSKIKESNFKKMVPIVYEKSQQTLDAEGLASSLLKLLSLRSGGAVYGLWGNGQGLLGISPEILFRVQKGQLQTMALAGTAPLDSDMSLLDDRKETHEHQLVIDDIALKLSEFSKKIDVQPTHELKLKHLKHLKTKISAELGETMSSDLILKLIGCMHPTAALGLFPRVDNWKQEMKAIRESHAADLYGAPFGVVTEGLVELIVAIRNLQWDSGQLYIGSGCGIVDKSDLDKEWSELILKRNSVKKNMGL